jgi:hypothetical protein
MWQKKVTNNLNFEKSVIIVLNLSYHWLSTVTSVDNDLNINSFLTVYLYMRLFLTYLWRVGGVNK